MEILIQGDFLTFSNKVCFYSKLVPLMTWPPTLLDLGLTTFLSQ